MTFLDIQGQRRLTATAVVGLMWLLLPVILISRVILGEDWIGLGLAGLAAASAATAAWRGLPEASPVRATLGFLLMAQVSILVAAF